MATIEESLSRTIKQSTKLTDGIGEDPELLTVPASLPLIQLGIMLELRAIRLILQAKAVM